MSVIKQDVLAHHFILNQQKIFVLVQRETESLKTKGREEEPELKRVKEEEEEYGSQPLQSVKKEDHIVPEQETDTLKEGLSGSVEIKEEPAELETKQVKKEEYGSEPQQMVKKEAEGICQDKNQGALRQETDNRTDFGSLEIKEEPEEQELQQIKEDDHQSESQQVVKMEVEAISRDEKQEVLNQIKKEEAESVSEKENKDVQKRETDTLMLTAYNKEIHHQPPELNGSQIPFENTPKAEQQQDIKTLEASGSSRHERQQKTAQKPRGQSDDVEKTMKEKKTDKGAPEPDPVPVQDFEEVSHVSTERTRLPSTKSGSSRAPLNTVDQSEDKETNMAVNTKWTAQETQQLIIFWACPDFQSKFESSTRKDKLYAELAQRMEKAGFNRTKEQITNKLKKLKQEYRNAKKDSSSSGTGRTNLPPHYAELDNVLGRRQAAQLTEPAESSHPAPSPLSSISEDSGTLTSRPSTSRALQDSGREVANDSFQCAALGIPRKRARKRKNDEVQDVLKYLKAAEEKAVEREVKAEEREERMFQQIQQSSSAMLGLLERLVTMLEKKQPSKN
ncbi:uncharacterized protein FYW61_004355 isoform 1-T2 [Anableps anableps]